MVRVFDHHLTSVMTEWGGKCIAYSLLGGKLGSKVEEGREMGVPLNINKCYMAKRSMDFLNIEQLAWMTFESVKELLYTLMELVAFRFCKTNKLVRQVPHVPNKCCNE